jgi:DNA-binding SARP family transcriptional activator
MTIPFSAPSLYLHTLGPAPRLVRRGADGGEETVLLGPGKPLALLLYLNSRIDRGASRDHLIDLLWADADLEHARQSLRQVAWQLRRKLGDEALIGEGDLLTLNAPIAADYLDLSEALRAGVLGRAIALYTGDFLGDFGVPGGAAFEQWADLLRERLRSGWIRALDTLAHQRHSEGAFREAVALARRRRDADPSHESAWRFVVESVLFSGDSVGAAMEARTLERLLAQEQRVPEPQTQALLAQIRELPPVLADKGVTGLQGDLIGREAEFRRLVEAWERARKGDGGVVHIGAPAGLGKTRLLRDVAHRLKGIGGRIIYLRAAPGSRQIPYAFIAELVRLLVELPGAAAVAPAVMGSLLALDPSLAARFPVAPDISEGTEALRRRFLAVVDLIASLSVESPLALLLDDMHWLDPDSLRVLAGLLARTAGLRVLLITAARPFPGREILLGEGRSIELPPLSESQVEALLASLGGVPDEAWGPDLVRRLHEVTEGSPLLVLETLQLACDDGWLVLEGGTWHCPDASRISLECRREGALRRRVERLEPPARLLLTTLSVAAAPVRAGTAADYTGMSEEEAATNLTLLEVRGFVERLGDRWRPAHDELAEAAVAATEPQQIAALHYRIGHALAEDPAASGFDLQRAAEHLIAGNAEHELPFLYRRWLAAASARRDLRDDRELAIALLLGAATDDRVRLLLRSRLLPRRLGLATRSARWAAAAVLLAVILLAAFFLHGASRPVRLALAQVPLSGDESRVIPVPVVEVQDAAGRRVRGAPTVVRVEMVGAPDGIRGEASVTTRDGLARFDRIGIHVFSLDSPRTLRFSADHLDSVEAVLPATSSNVLRLEGARINGQTLAPDRPVVTLHRGEAIDGVVTIRYSAQWPAASVLLGAFPNWGDRTSNYVAISSLATPVQDAILEHTVHVPGPEKPGRYRLILAFFAETEVRWIASGTNWKVGHPVWHDGNDIVDLSPDDLARAGSLGRIVRSWLFTNGRLDITLPMRVIEVRVL